MPDRGLVASPLAASLHRVMGYLNTDLDLVCDGDVMPLVGVLEQRGLQAIHVVREADGATRVGLESEDVGSSPDADPSRATGPEADGDLLRRTPERTIRSLLEAVEGLPAQARDIWNGCRAREFNIGYECGDGPWGFSQSLDTSTLARIAAVGGRLRVTLYPPAEPERPAGGASGFRARRAF
jgi:hypothetical protein